MRRGHDDIHVLQEIGDIATVAFVALVNYILTAADWSLYLLFAAAGVGIVLFVADTVVKMRRKHDE